MNLRVLEDTLPEAGKLHTERQQGQQRAPRMETWKTPTFKNGVERKALKTGECEGMGRAAGGQLWVTGWQQKPGSVSGVKVPERGDQMGKDRGHEVQGLAVLMERGPGRMPNRGTGELVQQTQGIETVLPRSLAEERAESWAGAADARDVNMLKSG